MKYGRLSNECLVLPSGFTSLAKSVCKRVIAETAEKIRLRGRVKFVRPLFCHYVFDDQIKDFRDIIRELLEIGTFVDTRACFAMARGDREIDGPYFHLSFDDGFKNHLTNALPVLDEFNIPALFFVPSGLIGAPHEEVARYCVEVAKYAAPIEMLSVSDIQEIVRSGYGIGSHTRTHARLSEISHDSMKLEEEVSGSKRDLEQMLGMSCDYMSWPFGNRADIDERALTLVKQAGFLGCFGAFRGRVIGGETDAYQVPRHHFEVQWPRRNIMFFARGLMASW